MAQQAGRVKRTTPSRWFVVDFTNIQAITYLPRKQKFLADDPGEDVTMPLIKLVEKPAVSQEQVLSLLGASVMRAANSYATAVLDGWTSAVESLGRKAGELCRAQRKTRTVRSKFDEVPGRGCSNCLIRMAPEVGLEPTTLRLTAECSAIELLRITRESATQPGGCTPIVITKQQMLVKVDNHSSTVSPFRF